MKKLLYTLLAAAATMFAVGCAKEAQMVDPALTGETVEATFTVGFADALTKAVSDGLSATQLVVGVYDKDLGYVESLSILPTSSAYKTAFVDHTATFNARLVKGHGYDLVFLAVAPDNGAYTIDLAAKTFTVNPEGLSNDDKRDAFYAVRSIEKVTGAVNQAVILTRPFAQLNVISSKDDYEAAAAARTVVGKSALKMAAPSVLNLVDGTVDTPVAYNLAAADMPEAKVNFEPYKTRGDYWLLTDYILVGESDMLDVNFLLYAEGSDDVLFEYNIPSVAFKRNYRTNVYGSVLTADSEFVITIDPMYDGELPLDYTGGDMPDIQMYDTTLPAPGSRITVKPGDKINFRAIHPVEGVEATYTSSSVSIGNFKVDQGDAEYIFKALTEGTTVVTIAFPPVNGGEVDPGDNPGGDEPGGDEPGGDEPGGDEPGGDEPGGDEPGGDEPGGDEPGDDDAGEAWDYTFTANPFSADAMTQNLDGQNWTLDMTGSTYFGFEGSNSARGAQFGKKAEPATKITLTSNFGSDYGVKKVVVNAAGASGTDAALSVKVGDVVLKCAGAATASVTTAATEYTFVADAVVAGDIVIAMEQTAAAAMYVKSISINPAANSNARPIYTKAEAASAGVNYAACTLIYTVVVTADGEDPNPPAPGASTYTKVTAAPEDWSGEYLIVYEGGEDGAGAVAFNGALTEKLDVASNGVAVTIANGEIASSEAIDAATFTIAAMEGGYSIKSASGIFISFSGASDKNGMTEGTDAVANTIAIDGEDGLLKISSDANVHWLKYNKSANDVRFRFYKAASEQQPVALYKKVNGSLPPVDPEEPVTAVITASDITVEVGAEKAVEATTNSSAPITYTVDESGVYTVTEDGVVTGVAVGEGKLLLKVEAVEGEFTAAEKEITVTVKSAQEGGHHTSITNAVNLGASETANCYVVTAPGSYKIPVVKGNSNVSAGTRASVQLLWETCNDANEVTENSVIAAVDYDDDDNFVYFKTPATLKPGNALIAALDASGAIIWSWHIWIPATTIAEVGEYSASKKYLMDRNLGAIVATAASGEADIRSVGLYYQWGRKDPFVGYKWNSPDVEVGTSGAAGRDMTKLDAAITLEESIAAPTSFVAFKGDWLTTHQNDLWADTKTIYDPCPAGYRVPSYDVTDGVFMKLTEVADFSANLDQRWWKIGNAIFPFTGCYDYDGNIAHPYDRTWLWSNQYHSNEDYAQAQYLYDNEGAWASEPGWGKRKACGVPVRCVKIAGEVPAPEEPVNPEPEITPATGIVLDGNLSDWADGEAVEDSNSIKEWKYGSDTNNLYFYFKITRSSIIAGKTEPYAYDSRRYIYIGLDTDNNTATGDVPGNGDMTIPGCEVLGLVFPFRGNATGASLADGNLYIVNGVDENSWTKIPAKDGTATGSQITAYGVVNDDFVYLEIGIPKAGLGTNTSGKMKVQFSLSSNLTTAKEINVK